MGGYAQKPNTTTQVGTNGAPLNPVPKPKPPTGNGNSIQEQRELEGKAPHEMVPENSRNTLVQAQLNAQQGGRIGSAMVDQGPACEPGGTGGTCFLSDAQRSRLLLGFGERVLAAQTQYVIALEQLRVDELLKKEPEQSSVLLDILLEVIVSVAIPGLGKAISMLRGAGARAVAEMTSGPSGAKAAALLVSDAGQKQIDNIIKGAVGVAKKKVQDGLKSDDPDAHDKKAANLSFLAILTDQSAQIYQSIRENSVANADDAMLVALFQAFDESMGHTVSAYKEALQAKLKRFERSGVGKIGVTEEGPSTAHLLQRNEPSFAQNNLHPSIMDQYETKAFWVKTPLGLRLGLYQRDYYKEPTTVEGGLENGRPLDPQEIASNAVENAQRPFKFMNYVPVEFESVALAMHRTQWGGEPLERTAQTPQEVSQARVTI